MQTHSRNSTAAKMAILALAATLLSTSAALAESAIFWTSAPVKSGETVLLTGYFPKPDTISLKVHGLTHSDTDWQAATSSRGSEIKPLRANENAVWFMLPVGAGGVYGFRLDEAGEAPLYGRVNLPEIWWTLAESPVSAPAIQSEIETNTASPGATLSLFGRCLTNGTNVPTVELLSTSGHITSLKAAAESPYAITSIIPDNIAPGKYRIRLRTLPGNAGSESSTREIEIHQKKSVSLKQLSVTDFGAVGNGKFDCSGAFTAALSKAATLGGAEVQIPAGAFVLSKPLEIPVGVYLAGESPEQTMLAFQETKSPPEVWIKGTQYFGLRDLAIYCGNHKAIVSSDMSGSPDKSGHIRIRNVRIVGNAVRKPATPEEIGQRAALIVKAFAVGFETVRLSGTDILIEDSHLQGSGTSLFLHNVNGAVMRRNQLLNGIGGLFAVSDSENIVNENNVFQGADLLATGSNYSTDSDRERCQNIYTANNSYSNMRGNDGEATTSDGGGGKYVGRIFKVEGRKLQLETTPTWRNSDWHGAAVVIMAGHGLGQWRTIASWNDATVELSEPFQIAPDTTSTICVVAAQLHWIFLRNHFQEAGMSIQVFGTGIEHIAAENDSTRGGGYNLVAADYFGINPVLNMQLISNEIRPGLNYYSPRNEVAGPSLLGARAQPGTAIIGLVFRDNIVADPAYIRIQQDGSAKVTGVLLEGNRVSSRPSFEVPAWASIANIWVDKTTGSQVLVLK
jgi:hypothetical protein